MFKVVLSILSAIFILNVANAKSKVQSLLDHGYDNPEQMICN